MSQPAPGKPPTKRQLAAEQTRQKLLRAALESFSRRPYAEVTVGDIARSAGVAHGLLSHHFNGKENLYAEVVREISRRLRSATSITADGSSGARLRGHFAAHLRFLVDHEDAALNLILRRGEAADLAWETFEVVRNEGTRSICALLDLDADAPELRLPMRGFSAACDEMARQWLTDGHTMPVEALVDHFIVFLASAVRAAHDRAPAPALRRALEELEHGTAHRQDTLQA
ncbi:helix-turn-helix domain-containing protein [Streptomyces sp. CRN 30]|uniref:TetR/AcrR family transcriptional regulator n=1 Tax=Streptomyces sp. CRN 30 TaxID=3075613 RepID=UPI002A804297|nr:helix-turn-helix domain-containing protein [Streptomyces sp. CRN 30]